MNRTWPEKAARLLLAFLRRPQDAPRWLNHNIRGGGIGSPLDLGVPWLSYSAIELLETYLRPDMTVYEYGGGGSTLFFARRTRQVVTVEDDADWIALLRFRLEAEGLSNVEVIHGTADFTDHGTFATSQYALALPDEPADLILATVPTTMHRRTCCARRCSMSRRSW